MSHSHGKVSFCHDYVCKALSLLTCIDTLNFLLKLCLAFICLVYLVGNHWGHVEVRGQCGALLLYSVRDSRDRTQVVRRGSKSLYPQSHLTIHPFLLMYSEAEVIQTGKKQCYWFHWVAEPAALGKVVVSFRIV